MSFPRYAEYKDSRVEWLGDLPQHWRTARLRHVTECLDGKRIPLNSAERADRQGSIPYWGANCIVDYVDEALFDEELVLLGEDGAPFFDRTKPVAFFSKGPIWPNNHVHVLKPNDELVGKYLVYTLNITDFADFIDGSTRDKLTQGQMCNIPIPLPPLSEQHAIASFLDRETAKIDALVAEQRRLIELLKEKRQAVISHAVTKGLEPNVPMKPSGIEWLREVPEHWTVGKCGNYSTILPGYAFPSTGFSDNEDAVRLLRGINVSVSEIRWDDTVFWERRDGDGFDRFELRNGDLVVGMDRPCIGAGVRVAKIGEKDLPCLLLQRVALIRTDERLLPDLLWYWLSSNVFVSYFEPETTGVSVPHISPRQLEDFTFPVPPIDKQRGILSALRTATTTIDCLASDAATAIKLLEERRTALISAAVTGKIDVRALASQEAA